MSKLNRTRFIDMLKLCKDGFNTPSKVAKKYGFKSAEVFTLWEAGIEPSSEFVNWLCSKLDVTEEYLTTPGESSQEVQLAIKIQRLPSDLEAAMMGVLHYFNSCHKNKVTPNYEAVESFVNAL